MVRYPLIVKPQRQPSRVRTDDRPATVTKPERESQSSESDGRYDIVADFGGQFSHLIGCSTWQTVKVPNPTNYPP